MKQGRTSVIQINTAKRLWRLLCQYASNERLPLTREANLLRSVSTSAGVSDSCVSMRATVASANPAPALMIRLSPALVFRAGWRLIERRLSIVLEQSRTAAAMDGFRNAMWYSIPYFRTKALFRGAEQPTERVIYLELIP